MRTETITREIFTFDELSEDARQRAIEKVRGQGIDIDHSHHEARQSVSAFCDLFDCKTGRDSWLDIIAHDSETRHDLTGQRLRTYLINNFPSAFYERKYRNSFHRAEKPTTPHRMRQVKPWSKGGYWVTLRSNFETESSCPFTGVCYDDDLLHPLKEFIKQPDGRTFEDLMSEAGESLRKSLDNEYEYANSDAGIIEIIEANEYEFTEDGKRA
jgi:hypothetical protein